MVIEENSTLVYNGQRYVVLNTIVEDNVKYGIASKYDENNVPSLTEYRVFTNDSNGNLELVRDLDLLNNKLLPIFQDNLNKLIEQYRAENNIQ